MLKLIVKAITYTTRENSRVHSRVVLKIIPRLLILSTNLSAQKERLEALKISQSKIDFTFVERLVREAPAFDISSAVNLIHKMGDRGPIYHEIQKESF